MRSLPIKPLKLKKNDLLPGLVSVLVLLSCYQITVFYYIWYLTFVLAVFGIATTSFTSRYTPSLVAVSLSGIILLDMAFTFIHGEPGIWVMYRFSRAILFIIWADMYCVKYTAVFFNTIEKVVGGILVIQLAFQLIKPEYFGYTAAGNSVNLLISDNMLGYIFVPYIALIIVKSLLYKGKVSFFTWIMTGLCCFSMIISEAGTGIVGVCFFVLMVAFSICYKGKFSLDLRLYAVVYIAFLVGIIVFSIQNYFDFLITDILNKDLTFSGRLAIWSAALDTIKNNPLYGYGVTSVGRAVVAQVGGTMWGPHNYFFSLILETTVVGFFLYCVAFWDVAQKLRRNKDKVIVAVIASGIMAMFVMYITEGETWIPGQYLILVLAYHVYQFTPSKEREYVRIKRRKFRLRRRNNILNRDKKTIGYS